jgi:hypothetical protein
MINTSTKSKPIAGLKIKPKPQEPPKELYVDVCKPDTCTGLINTQSSSDPSAQYQRQQIIQNTVKVSSSLYAMNKASLNVYQSQYSDSVTASSDASSNAISNWNQMSDRKEPHIQKEAISMKSSVSLRPGNLTPGGIGCDIKHNSYDRYLARLKGSAPLRRERLPANYGENVPFNPAKPVYGGKTVKTSIGTSDCTICVIQPPVPPIPTIGTFIYSFIFTGTIPSNKTAEEYFSQYIPIINTGYSFQYTTTVTIESTLVTVIVNYGFVNSNNNDGLCFTQATGNFYNTYATELTIVTFGKIPLSPGGSQFTKLNTLPIFPIELLLLGMDTLGVLEPDVPEILIGSSLAYCFAGITDGFGLDNTVSDYILSQWVITNAINVSHMFYNSTVNPSEFILDLTYIDDLTSMFEGASEFNPGTTIMTIQAIPSSRYSITARAVVRPKVVKIQSKMLANTRKLVGRPIFKYANLNARPQSYRRSTLKVALEPSSFADMSGMFYGCSSFDPDPEGFEFLGIPTNMSEMFYGCTEFNQPLNSVSNPITNLITEEVTDMSYMFYNATSFNQPMIATAGGFNVTNVTDMSYMFTNAENFNQDITSWETPNLVTSVNIFSNSAIVPENIPPYFVFNYTFMYSGLETDFTPYLPVLNADSSFILSVTQSPLASSIVSPITTPILITMSCNYKFTDNGTTNDGVTFNNPSLKTFYNTHTSDLTITQFAGINLSRGGSQFTGLNSIKITDTVSPSILSNTSLSNCFSGLSAFNNDIRAWNTVGVINMNRMFENATIFNKNISGWNVTNVLSYTNFSTGAALTPSNKPRFVVPPVGFIYSFTYQGTETDLTPYIPILNANNSFTYTSVITKDQSNLVKVEINFSYTDGGFNDGLTFNGLSGFYSSGLVSGLTINQFYNIPLSRAGQQFINLTTPTIILAVDAPTILSNTSLELCFSSFIGSNPFNSNISNWNITNVINMTRMFWYSTEFNQDISSWNTTNVTNVTSMFEGAVNFNQNISGWVTTNTTAFANFYLNSGLSIGNVPPKFR